MYILWTINKMTLLEIPTVYLNQDSVPLVYQIAVITEDKQIKADECTTDSRVTLNQ